MKKTNKILCVFLLLISLSSLSFATNDGSLLLKGLEAYKQKDWTTALFFLRKASTLPENLNAETWYVLIMAEVYASDFDGVLTDGSYFVQKFTDSPYIPQVEYQMARATFLLEDYNQALVLFDEFCKKYPSHELYSSALFWKAEALYQLYNYVDAEKLFKVIISDYPESPKIVEAAFRVELLEQRAREEKLLYLLRVTGEENLAAREDYERQIKQYQSEESINFRLKVTELSMLVESLQEELEEANTRIENLLFKVNEITTENENLTVALQEAKKIAAEVSYDAELQIKSYEEQLRIQAKENELRLLEEQKQRENQNAAPVFSQEELSAEIYGNKESSYVPSEGNSQNDTMSSIDYELQELRKKAKELESLLAD